MLVSTVWKVIKGQKVISIPVTSKATKEDDGDGAHQITIWLQKT